MAASVENRSVMEQTEPAVTTRGLPSDPLNIYIYKVVKNNSIGISPEGHHLPDEEYDRLLTTDAIQNALGDSHEVSSLVNYILSDAKKTFLTLLLALPHCEHLQEIMNDLMVCGFSDTLLATQKLDASYLKHKFWNEITLDDFKTKRMPFIVPTFEVEIFKYEFENDRILPFRALDGSHTPSSNGHFSEVRCVEMLASKQNKVKVLNKTLKVALKTLKNINDHGYDIYKEWEREARAHKQLNGKSGNIIEAFGAYRQIAKSPQNDAYHLVLEWADGGSLLDFWKLYSAPQVNHSDVDEVRRRIKDMLDQIYGLSDALVVMHSTKAQSAESYTSESTLSSKVHPPRSSIYGKDRAPEASKPSTESVYLPTFTVDPVMDRTVAVIPFSSDPATLEVNTGFDTQNWRHGDIKPENILRFIDSKHGDRLGTLKLADLGRAQQHRFVTEIRRTKGNELWRTRWYEPPDLEKTNHKKAHEKISRLFNIWSMGCVIFESALWLLYGCKNNFMNTSGLASGDNGGTPYWREEKGGYRLTDNVTGWMEHILLLDYERSSAIGDLVKLVKDRLLKIDLPPNSDVYKDGFRTNAKDLREQLSKIVEKATNDKEYLFSCAGRTNFSQTQPINPGLNSPSRSSSNFLSVDDSRSVGFPGTPGWRTAIAQQRVYTNCIKNEWEISPENKTIIDLILGGRTFDYRQQKLCSDCEAIEILSPHPRMSLDMRTLKMKSTQPTCDLCELIYSAANDQGLTTRSKISLKRLENNLVLEDNDLKCLRLIETEARVGPQSAPTLVPLAGNREISAEDLVTFMKLPLEWLKECDDKHGEVCISNRKSHVLPTRLISVENPKKPKIIATADLPSNILAKGIRYVALSHKWGDIPGNAITTRRNIEQRKKKIPMGELPLSFKNAIAITSSLDCPYLWIDSLCILQGPAGDFNTEADKMQTTFNGAYCVLAACSAHSAMDGFLPNSKSRSMCVKIGNVLVSPVTVDFERDVLQSPLSRRGWVLQERALARRTIFLTETQTYWECGHGIRCEALSKLKNDKAAFLGDPNFPDYTIRPESTVGEQIDLSITLFQHYTQLEFSHPEDRPIAIDGLIERLTMAFKTRSLAGLFKTYWGRCLLWRRADESTPLKKIPQGQSSRKVPPTWSWMAFEGVISFIEPEGGQVDWNNSGVTLPFNSLTRDQASWLSTSCHEDSVAIKAKAYAFTILADTPSNEASLYYDAEEISSAKCVIIGSGKQLTSDASTKTNYVLIVKPVSDFPGITSYERCGVGYLPGKFIQLDGSSLYITIE
ncbi:hypothetical protein EYC80_004558 [Monilinia laxa]|uniref:Protein kinase domain-containing protein n=1 Tax=Monilinia laxa TaxID=61186 RepID=A0A5N6KHD4_MONLA|nr:hypothetical protein EYC80_004558 [Monilinia laxa]